MLDGALDADQYSNDPIQTVREQTKAFEVALGRFFQACARDQATCGFGDGDPWSAFDDLVDSMNAKPLPASGTDPRPVDGDDLLAGSLVTLYSKDTWGLLAQALQLAAAGDGTGVRILVDAYYGRLDDGTYDPFGDRFFAIASLEARFPEPDVEDFLELGADDYELFDHFWFNSGYYDLAQALWPVRPKGVYYGPYEAPESAPTTLVVGTRYDPATPYKGARRLVRQLGNARLLTMIGDGHTAYLEGSPCIDAAIEGYLEAGTVPAAGTVCRQDVPFALPQAQAAGSRGHAARPAARGAAPDAARAARGSSPPAEASGARPGGVAPSGRPPWPGARRAAAAQPRRQAATQSIWTWPLAPAGGGPPFRRVSVCRTQCMGELGTRLVETPTGWPSRMKRATPGAHSRTAVCHCGNGARGQKRSWSELELAPMWCR